MGNLKENFWSQKIQVVFFWNLSFPRAQRAYAEISGKYHKNQFQQ